jgi:hypothetical protein
MPIASFRAGIKMSVEASRSSAPTSTDGSWWLGGRWHDVIPTSLPTIQEMNALIYAPGFGGRRSLNQQPPVVGRKWSEGDLDVNVVADNLGLFLLGAMGSLSSNAVPSTTATLVATEALNAASKSLVLTDQPSDGGAILRFLVSGTSGGGTISVSGIDAYGNGASEQISFSSAGSFFTRTSFSSIAASGIQITSQNLNGSVNISGYKYFEHTFSASNQDATFSIEKLGMAEAGAASRSFIYPGMVLRELTINTPAETPDGTVQLNASFEGDVTAASNSTTLNHASALKIWPSWVLSISRDGSAYHKITNQSFTINTGNRNYRAAAGVQGPQGSFFGPRELTGAFDLLVDDEGEYNRWRGASRQALVFTWNTDWKLTSAQDMALSASITDAYISDKSNGDSDGAQIFSCDFRAIAGNDDIVKFKLINGCPPTAYGSPL